MRRPFRFSLGATTEKFKAPVELSTEQEPKGIRSKSEGRRKAAMDNKKANLICNRYTEVELREAIS